MRNEEQQTWSGLRTRAVSYLSPDLSRQVVRQAVLQREIRRRQPLLVLATVVILFFTVNTFNWWRAQSEEKQQLAQWEEWKNFQQVVLTAL